MVHGKKFIYCTIYLCIKILEKLEEATVEIEKEEEAKKEPGEGEQMEKYEEKIQDEKQIGKNDECTCKLVFDS